MAKLFKEMTKEELVSKQAELQKRYDDFKAMNLKLDMSRGKPGADQLDLSADMLDCNDYFSDGVDLRNYGLLDGIPSCKKLFADLMGVDTKNVIIGPNASLTLMFDYISQCYTHGAGDKRGVRQARLNFFALFPAMTAILQFLNISELR